MPIYQEQQKQVQQGSALQFQVDSGINLNNVVPTVSPVPTEDINGQYRRTQNVINALKPFSGILMRKAAEDKAKKEKDDAIRGRLAYAQKKMDEGNEEFNLAEHPEAFRAAYASAKAQSIYNQKINGLKANIKNSPGLYSTNGGADGKPIIAKQFEDIADSLGDDAENSGLTGDIEKKSFFNKAASLIVNAQPAFETYGINLDAQRRQAELETLVKSNVWEEIKKFPKFRVSEKTQIPAFLSDGGQQKNMSIRVDVHGAKANGLQGMISSIMNHEGASPNFTFTYDKKAFNNIEFDLQFEAENKGELWEGIVESLQKKNIAVYDTGKNDKTGKRQLFLLNLETDQKLINAYNIVLGKDVGATTYTPPQAFKGALTAVKNVLNENDANGFIGSHIVEAAMKSHNVDMLTEEYFRKVFENAEVGDVVFRSLTEEIDKAVEDIKENIELREKRKAYFSTKAKRQYHIISGNEELYNVNTVYDGIMEATSGKKLPKQVVGAIHSVIRKFYRKV